MAAQEGHLDILTALLAAGASPSTAETTTGSTPVFIAAKKGHLDILTTLLAAGASPSTANINGTTPLKIAQSKGYTACAALLQRHLTP
jgi:cytohesin